MGLTSTRFFSNNNDLLEGGRKKHVPETPLVVEVTKENEQMYREKADEFTSQDGKVRTYDKIERKKVKFSSFLQ